MTDAGYLLDTHAFLWMVCDDPRLSDRAAATVLRPSNRLVLSVASVWEMAIKASLGKLTIRGSLKDLVEQQTDQLGIMRLPVELDHAVAVQELPFHHRDPFDRLLVAQARHEGLALVSADEMLDRYDVTRIW